MAGITDVVAEFEEVMGGISPEARGVKLDGQGLADPDRFRQHLRKQLREWYFDRLTCASAMERLRLYPVWECIHGG